MISNKKHMFISYPIIAFLFIVDQVTKFVFTDVYYNLIPNVLSVHYSENTGAAWSIFAGSVVFLATMSIVFLIVLIIFSHKFKEKSVFYSISYAFIIGGAFGNLFDRLVHGFVKDFFKTEFMNFPIFNFADSFLIFGVIMFSIFVLFIYPQVEMKLEKIRNKEKQENKEIK